MNIDLTINKKQREENAKFCKEKGVTLPTFEMMHNPDLVPGEIKDRLKNVGLWDLDPANLYRISWKNEKLDKGGLYGGVNHITLPPALTGCKATITMLSGRWFPTGAHKVGATFGCLTPRLITGQYNPAKTKAVWPSTGNYCRGGAYMSNLLGVYSVAILPEGMSKERFEWLKKVAGETIATPGCESNVKEIFDKCNELRRSGDDLQIFDQFEELGNPLWHFNVTGKAMEELCETEFKGMNVAGVISSSGSGGTLASGYYIKTKYPHAKLAVAEALQCPTILMNGFGGHRIEGIGDKHIPWVHDCKNTDFTIDVDDEVPMRLLRLFNEPVGQKALKEAGIDQELIDQLHLLGISGVGNLIAAIKFAKYNELTENDLVLSIATDSMQLYGSRLQELTAERGEYTANDAQRDIQLLKDINIDFMKELGYYDRKAVHNLKYYTWIEQQGRELKELNDQWYDHDNYWFGTFNEVGKIDELIKEFNDMIAHA